MSAALVIVGTLLGAAPSSVPVDRAPESAERGLFIRSYQAARVAASIVDDAGNCLADVTFGAGRKPCSPLPAGTRASIRWALLAPLPKDYDNVKRCDDPAANAGCHDPIQYRKEELMSLRGRFSFEIAEVPQLGAAGTHRLVAQVTWHNATLTAPMQTALTSGDDMADQAFEIVVRTGDDYVGMATELIGVPFVLGPVDIPGIGHQTDRRLGADCVAVVIYGQRRLGTPVAYMAPAALERQLQRVGAAQTLVGKDGKVADVGRVRRGDVLDFGFQTAVLSQVSSSSGRLSGADMVIHTYHGLTEEVRVDRLPYRHHPLQVLRWPTPVNATQ